MEPPKLPFGVEAGNAVYSGCGKRLKPAGNSKWQNADPNATRPADDRPRVTNVPPDHGAQLERLLLTLPHRSYPAAIDASSLSANERLVWLTAREREVLCLYLDNRNPKEVACRLGTSTQTTKNQLATIERKLGVDSREDLLVYIFSLLDDPRSRAQANRASDRTAQ